MTTNQNAEEVRGTVIEAQQIRHWDLLAEAWILHNGPMKDAGVVIRSLVATIANRDATITAQSEELERLRGEIDEAKQYICRAAPDNRDYNDADRLFIWIHNFGKDMAMEYAEKKYLTDYQALQAELHDVRRAIVDQCGPRLTWHHGLDIEITQCPCCKYWWREGEQEGHTDQCSWDTARQALAVDGGDNNG